MRLLASGLDILVFGALAVMGYAVVALLFRLARRYGPTGIGGRDGSAAPGSADSLAAQARGDAALAGRADSNEPATPGRARDSRAPDVAEAGSPASVPPPGAAGEIRFCADETCREVNPAGARFCRRCGGPLE